MAGLSSVSIVWQDGTSLNAEPANTATTGKLTRLGVVHNAEVLGVTADLNGYRSILFEPDTDLIFEPVRLVQEFNYQITVTLPLSLEHAFAEKTACKNPAWPFFNPYLAPFVQLMPPRLWKEAGGKTVIGAIFNARGYSGVIDFTVRNEEHRIGVEVVTAKLRYETEFKHLVADVAAQQVQLLYEIGAVAGERLTAKVAAQPDLSGALFQMRRLMLADQLPAAVGQILSAPLETLISDEQRSGSDKAGRRPDAALIARRAPHLALVSGGPLASLFSGYTPQSLPVAVKRQSVDNPENRYVKSFLRELQELLTLLEDACQCDGKWLQAEAVHQWLETVDEWLTNSLWTDVGSLIGIPQNSQHLQKSDGYRDLFKADVELREALGIPLSDERIERTQTPLGDLKPVETLYEYWCYFTIRDILRRLYGADISAGKGLVIQSAGRLSMRLAADTDGYGAIFKKDLPPNTEVHLFFHRRFRPKPDAQWGEWSGTYSVSFDPDISLAIKTPYITHWLSFDAKYRLDHVVWRDEENSQDKQTTAEPSYKQSDLNKMHCYRDAILGTRGAYILYPGAEETKVDPFLRTAAENRCGIGVPSVGAFSLRPKCQSQIDIIAKFIKQMVDLLGTASSYAEETGLD